MFDLMLFKKTQVQGGMFPLNLNHPKTQVVHELIALNEKS